MFKFKKFISVQILLFAIVVDFAIVFGLQIIFRTLKVPHLPQTFFVFQVIKQCLWIISAFFIYEYAKHKLILGYEHYKPFDVHFSSIILIITSACILSNFSAVILSLIGITSHTDTGIIYAESVFHKILTGVILAPIYEELFHRGIVYKQLRYITNFYIAAILSALLWGILHWNVPQGICAFIMGLFLAFVYEKFKLLWIPMLCHAILNGFSILIQVFTTHMKNTTQIVTSSKPLVHDITFFSSSIFIIVIDLVILYFIIKTLSMKRSPECICGNLEQIIESV